MAKNGYLQKRKDTIEAYVQTTADIYSQLIADMAVIALHEEFGFGPERCYRFYAKLMELTEIYHDALGVRSRKEEVEGRQEHLQDLMDRKLREAEGKYFDQTFAERYPGVKKVTYGKRT